MSNPIILKVSAITADAPNLKTYTFKHPLNAKPGQFVMVWLPGVDEVPMSIGWQTEKEFRIGIANAGDCTAKIHEQIKVGDKLGIRGPYGKGFELNNYKKIAVVGGGYGTPPMLSLAQAARLKNIKVTAILGARSSDYIIYEKQFKKLGCEIKISTDDGSKGHKGYCTEVLENLLKKEKIDCVYTCGPEKMMVKVARISMEQDVDCQVSLERYMKCGFGICGQCCMDDSGIRICKDGPVLTGEQALKLREFGKYTRVNSGKVHPSE